MNVVRTLMDTVRPAVRAKRRFFGPTRPTWTEEFELIATVLRQGARVTTKLPIDVQRRVMEPVKRPPAHGSQFERAKVAGIRSAWCHPKDPCADSVVLYLHGGGYATGSLRSHRDLVDRLAHASGGRVLALDYRLAPEHPFPAALEDALAAYRALLDAGISHEKIIIAGDSAGGGLTLSTLFCLRDAGQPLPAGAALISPWVDLDSSRPSMFENARWDYVSRNGLRDFARFFTAHHNHRNPLASPVYGNFSGLPPLLIHAGEIEGLRDDAVAVHEKAVAAGVKSELKIWEDMIHAFHVIAAICPPGREAIKEMGAFVRERTGNASERYENVRPRVAG
jgi:epsilon-lactone hydrolase